MKTTKRLGCLLLVLAMCLALGVSAFAADTEYSITISNSIQGSTYNAYKIFDVTYDDEGHYSYTLTDTATTVEGVTTHSNPWYELIGETTAIGDVANPFTLTATTGEAGDGAVIYNVSVATDPNTGEAYTDEEIIAYLNAAIAQLATYTEGSEGTSGSWSVSSGLAVAGTVTGNGGTVVLELEEPGYYFVTTTTGSIVSITTNDPTATIIDKQTPPPDIEKVIVQSDGTGESYEADGMGEEVTFDVTATVPITETIDEQDGSQTYNYVTDYTITDSMSNGLLIELSDGQFTSDEDNEGVMHYYLSEDLVNQWITLTNGAGDELTFTNFVYDYSFELLGYDTYTDEITGRTYHTFTGFVLTYYTYNVDQYKTDLRAALTEAGYDLNSIWPEGQEWPTASAIGADFDFDSEAYFEEYDRNTNTVGTVYPANASIEIQYTAHVTSLEGYENTNNIVLEHNVTPFDHPTPWSPTPGPEKFAKDYVYSWELQILKVDGDDKVTPLEGATFTLYSENMKNVKVGHSYLYVPLSLFEDGVYTDGDDTYNLVDFESTHYVATAWDDNDNATAWQVGEGEKEDGSDTYVRIMTGNAEVDDSGTEHLVTATTNENGEIDFDGLGTGVYILTEITAPDGYNLIKDPIVFEITFEETSDEVGRFTVTYGTVDDEGNFTPNQSDYGTTLNDNYILVETIENTSGTLLPGTGGIGTTIFYIVGAVLVCGAVVVLVTRRRVNGKAEG